MTTLTEFLTSLDSTEEHVGVYASPQDPDNEWTVAGYFAVDGEIPEGWVWVGDLNALSYGRVDLSSLSDSDLAEIPDLDTWWAEYARDQVSDFLASLIA